MIGIFDSGFGGLTVMKEYLKKYPQYDYLYLGDQANFPYGGHSAERLNKLIEQNIEFLAKKGCKLIIIACNTTSSIALPHLQKKYKGNPVILGTLVPAVEKALKRSRFGNIGVIGTRTTIEIGAYTRELKKYAAEYYKPKDKRANKEIRVIEKATPLLTPLVEEGLIKHVVTRMMIRKYLRPLKHAHVDTLILGCTHYPLLQKEIDRISGKQCQIISPSQASVEAIGDYFQKHPELEKKLSKGSSRTYYVTDFKEQFNNLASAFMGSKIKLEKIEI